MQSEMRRAMMVRHLETMVAAGKRVTSHLERIERAAEDSEPSVPDHDFAAFVLEEVASVLRMFAEDSARERQGLDRDALRLVAGE